MSIANIAMLSIIEIFGDFKLKEYARTKVSTSLYSGIIGYCGVIFFLIKSLEEGNIIYVNGMWDGTSAIIETIAAYIILGERLVHTYQYIGIAMISFGLLMLYGGGIAF